MKDLIIIVFAILLIASCSDQMQYPISELTQTGRNLANNYQLVIRHGKESDTVRLEPK